MRIVSLLTLLGYIILCWTPTAFGFTFNDKLVDAADIGNYKQAKYLLDMGHLPDSTGDFETTALMRAALRGHTQIVNLLIRSGAYVNASDVGGDTALHLAARNGHVEVVKLLIESDAYIDMPDKEKWTPLMRAVMAKKHDVVKYLLAKGADVSASNDIDESAFIHASVIGKPDIMNAILRSKTLAKVPSYHQKIANDIISKKGHKYLKKMIAAAFEKIDRPADLFADNKAMTRKTRDILSISDRHPKREEHTDNVLDDASSSYSSYETDYGEWASESAVETSTPAETARNVGGAPVNEKSAEYARNNIPFLPRPTIKPRYNTTDDGSVYSMQLGAFSSEGKAMSAWIQLGLQAKSELYGLRPHIVKNDDKSTGNQVYRLRAGRFAQMQDANARCTNLRLNNIECLTVKESTEIADTAIRYGPADLAPQYARKAVVSKASAEHRDNRQSKKIKIDSGKISKNDLPFYDKPKPKEIIVEKEEKQPKLVMSSDLPWMLEEGYVERNHWILPVYNDDTGYIRTASDMNVPAVASMRPLSMPPAEHFERAVAETPAASQKKADAVQPQATPVQTNIVSTRQQLRESVQKNNYALSRKVKSEDIVPIQQQHRQYQRFASLQNQGASSAREPIDLQNQNQQYSAPVTGIARPSDGVDAAFLRADEEAARQYARSEFFRKRGIEQPVAKETQEAEYYRKPASVPKKKAAVSRAVLVPDEEYFKDGKYDYSQLDESESAGAWIKIAGFANKQAADDYATRMFKYDEKLSQLQIMTIDAPTTFGRGISLKVGPLTTQQEAQELCKVVSSGGGKCVVVESGLAAKSSKSKFATPMFKKERSAGLSHWINMGTFADKPEAEYYWMFLQEDNGDVLDGLQYVTKDASSHGEFGEDAVQLSIGPFKQKSRAEQICNIMHYRNVACVVK